MKALEEKIVREGTVLPGNVLKVGSFLNQQIDTAFLKEMAKEAKRLFEGIPVTKVLTVEASGIAFATAVGLFKNLVSLALVLGTNMISRKIQGVSVID